MGHEIEIAQILVVLTSVVNSHTVRANSVTFAVAKPVTVKKGTSVRREKLSIWGEDVHPRFTAKRASAPN